MKSTYRFPGEERFVVDHFRKDAADAPDIHGRGVRHRAQQNLRCTVP